MRAICTVIINTDKLLCIGRKIACTEPYNIIPAVAKARNKRIVGIKNKLSFGMNTILYGIVNPFRMTVSCELVTVKVCDNIMSRCNVFEGIFCKAFVTFNEKNIRFNLARKSTTAENKSCNALNLVRTLFVPGNFLPLSQRICAIISTVDVLPLLPVTATIYFGSSIRPRISGQSLSAICPGRLLPLPSNPPTNFRTLHTIIVNSFSFCHFLN